MSWRAIEKHFRLWSQFINVPTPDHNTIRLWFLKLGLFLLQQPKQKRTDWLFIVDTIIGIGQNKCLVILGLSYQTWLSKYLNNANNFAKFQGIDRHDVSVLELVILTNTNGEIVFEKINNLAAQVGQPLQIISDRGPDIKKADATPFAERSGGEWRVARARRKGSAPSRYRFIYKRTS